MRTTISNAAILSVFLAGIAASAQGRLPEGPVWGGGSFQPKGANVLFATGDGCALCHSPGENAIALKNKLGDDVSPHGLWQATMMANAFRDPYFRAQLSRETFAHPEKAADIEGLCLRCHAPMVSHTMRLADEKMPRFADLKDHALAQDGVSCTVCHQAQPTNLRKPESFSGMLDIQPGRVIFGPYEDPAQGPMRMHSRFTPTHGPHIKESAVCGSCHTLTTQHAPNADPFFEQTPYLEWRNSIYTDEDGPSPESRTCQECHMPDQGTMKIARNPRGFDFNITPRRNVGAHAFYGGNAYMLEIFKSRRKDLGVTAEDEALTRAIKATRRQLAEDTAKITIKETKRDGASLDFDVKVENLTGHKFPAGYPSRRAWLMVEVKAGNTEVFSSGAFTMKGGIEGIADERGLTHKNVVTQPSDVIIYETIALDAAGKPTTMLSEMAKLAKDTRLLPLGWRKDGPHADVTKPVGIGDDPDFLAGEDIVHYRLKLPDGTDGRLTILVRLLYQTIPPAWVEPFRSVPTDEAKMFVAMVDEAPPKPELISLAVEIVE